MDCRRGRTRRLGKSELLSAKSSAGDADGELPKETPQARANSSRTAALRVPAGRFRQNQVRESRLC